MSDKAKRTPPRYLRPLMAMRGALLADRLDSLVRERQFRKALAIVERELRKYDYPISWKVREFQLHHFLEHDAWVIDRAKGLLGELTEERKLSVEDREFLRLYVSKLAEFSSSNLFGNSERARAAYALDVRNLDWAKISPTLREIFPLTEDSPS